MKHREAMKQRGGPAAAALRGALPLGLALLAACRGTAPRASDASELRGAHAASEAPAPGLATWPGPEGVAPDASRLTADVRWLADDAREGRRAGTPGEEASAVWIAARLEALGLEPAGEDGWFQSFEVPLPARDGGGSRVVWPRAEETSSGWEAVATEVADVVPLFCSDAGRVKGLCVFAGYGIVHEPRGWDDYAGLDVSGKVVLLVRGTPRVAVEPEPEPDSGPEPELEAPHDTAVSSAQAGWGSKGSIFHKVMEAKRRGAQAVLLVPHPSAAGEPLLPFDAGQTAEAGIPALMVGLADAEAMVYRFAERVAALDRGERLVIPPDEGRFRGASGELEVAADVVRATGVARNVLGRLRGVDPGRTVVVGAHFDHLGRGGVGSLAREQRGAIHNGADDNASGTAVVLDLARCLAAGPPPPGDVVFALWSGEELGLLGSEHWVKSPTVPLEDVRCNLTFDMVGRAGDGALAVLGAGSAAPLVGWLETAGPRAELDLQVSSSGQGMGGSDHQVFLKHEIPALHFFSGVHPDYHKPSDDVERFEPTGAERVARLALSLLWSIQEAPQLAWTAPAAEEGERKVEGGFNAWLGSVPEYGYDGVGVLLSGTSEGSPAERAGLLAGDVLVGLGDVEVANIYDLVYALQHYKPGDVVVARYLRDGREERVQLTLMSRAIE